MEENKNFETRLYDITNMVGCYEYRQLGKGKPYIYQAIVISLKEFMEDFLSEFGQPELTTELTKPETKLTTSEPKQVEEAQSEPKRRGRKKKDVIITEEAEEIPDNLGAPMGKEEEQAPKRRELVFKEGLDKDLASFSTIEDVNDDKIANENLGPIPLANSLPKQGEHPFWKGPAQFVWYLPVERWPIYLADLLESEKFYPDQLSLYDTKRLEEAKRVGVDIEFVTAIIDKETKRMVSIEDFKEADYADDEKGMEGLVELKESGFLKEFVAKVDPDKILLKFLTRFGQNKHIVEDLQTIYEEHTEHPNKYIHW